MTEFVHLHLHSHYSLLDGANKIEPVITRAVEFGMPAIALTDHGNLFGAVQFHDTAVKYGIKPIIGCEVYVAREGRTTRNGRSDGSNHLVLLATNPEGFANLSRLVSLAYLEGFYYKPRIDKELLQTYRSGLIGLSACLKGSVAWHLKGDQFEEAKKQAGELAEILGPGNFFLEMQDHGLEEQKKVNAGMVQLARSLGLPLVATNDCHYLNQEDSEAHDVLLCIQTGKTVQDDNRMSYRGDQFFVKSPEQMGALFADFPEALRNTVEIASRCNFELVNPGSIFPNFTVPEGFTIDSYFERVVREGFDGRLPFLEELEKLGKLSHPIEEYRGRLDSEIQMIQKMNFPAYFLIVWDFIRYARDSGIPVGPGRGSAAGSLVSYALRITDVDPLRYDLLFERFLNPERISPPDIDIDFCTDRRTEVIDYVTRKYGRQNVCQIITFGTMAARGVIRDVGRALNIPYAEVDKIARLVPQELGTTLEKSLEAVKELRDIAEDERYSNLVTIARKLEGLARHASTHAAGVVIAPRPLLELIPLYKSNKDEITTQFSMTDLERVGLLKMDFLALITLTVIHHTLEQIEREHGTKLDLNRIELNEPETLQIFCEGRTSGIFQFESSGMRDILRRLRPDRFEDLIALNALYRPGPIKGGMIDDFIKRRHGQVKSEYEVPILEEVLKETYGVIVYQEQVMQIASKMAGFSLGEADLLRRAMGKKKASVMVAQRAKFIEGCLARGYSKVKADRIFDLMEQFAGYGFNKSHSTAYALLAYQTAYLKAHYPVEFMAALLTSEISNSAKLVKYIGECKEMGIRVIQPDINTSDLFFQARGGTIHFGLAAIHNVGESALRSVLTAREQEGGFRGFYHFCEKVDLRLANKRVLEALIKSGAFDGLKYRRRALLDSLDKALDHAQKMQKDRISGQGGLFANLGPASSETADVPDIPEWPERLKWAYEKEALGFYLTGHPLQQYASELKRFVQFSLGDLSDDLAGREITVAGVVTGLRKTRNRKGEAMANFVLEDLTGTMEVLVWPQAYDRGKDLLETDSPLLVTGRYDTESSNGNAEARLLCTAIQPMDSVWNDVVQKARISLPVAGLQPEKILALQNLITSNPGRCLVEFELVKELYRIHVVPNRDLRVNPVPSFVRAVENLFGDNSVTLYT